jgi:SAM-dependent MidA family methyltransferase
MTRLKARIVDLIEALGPIPVNEYMALCLYDPRDGYYTTREPFGPGGDFVTAPEISQMFGELVAVWLYSAWQALGRPFPVTIAEIGPGRGTLMKDLVRSLHRLHSVLTANASFAMVETSPRLAEIQKAELATANVDIAWHEAVETLPDATLLIVGNELFDAVPIRQFVRAGTGWSERMIGIDDGDELIFLAGASSIDPGLLPDEAVNAPQGAIVEIAPARAAMMATIAARISQAGGAGLFFDYGHLRPGVGDTLQALRHHRYQGVLEAPGEADLTAHVDFSALAEVVRAYGLDAHLTTQRGFLLAMGLIERAGQLGSLGSDLEREKISAAAERLAGADQMGTLFKVLAVLPSGVAVPPFEGVAAS